MDNRETCGYLYWWRAEAGLRALAWHITSEYSSISGMIFPLESVQLGLRIDSYIECTKGILSVECDWKLSRSHRRSHAPIQARSQSQIHSFPSKIRPPLWYTSILLLLTYIYSPTLSLHDSLKYTSWLLLRSNGIVSTIHLYTFPYPMKVYMTLIKFSWAKLLWDQKDLVEAVVSLIGLIF